MKEMNDPAAPSASTATSPARAPTRTMDSSSGQGPEVDPSPPRGIPARLRSFARSAAGLIIVVSATVLCGWQFDSEAIKRVAPGLPAMNPATAICFILGGLALLLKTSQQRSRRRTLAADACALVVAAVGSVRLVGYLLDSEIGIDTLVYPDRVEAGLLGPNRMAPNTATAFVLGAAAILLLDFETRRGRRPAQYLAISQVVFALLALFGYAYGVMSFYRVSTFIPMALPTAVCFLVMATGILLARPESGAMAIATGPSLGGVMARRLLPVILLLPPSLGALRLAGEQVGWYDTSFGVALSVVFTLVILGVVTALTSRSLHRIDLARRQTETALRHQSQLFQNVLESLAEGVVVADRLGRFVHWNPAAQRMIGRGPADIPLEQWAKHYQTYLADGETIMPTDQLPLVRAIRGEKVDNCEVLLKPPGAAGHHWLQINARPLMDEGGAPTGGVVVFRNVSERRRSEHALAESQARLRAIIDNASAVIVQKDLEGRYVLINKRFEEMFDLRQETVLGRTDEDLFPAEVARRLRANDVQVIQQNRPFQFEELVPQEGKDRVYLSLKFPLHSGDGTATGVCAISTDITERNQMLAALRESEDRYRTVVNTIIDGIITINERGIMTFVNPAAAKLFGYAEEEMLGANVSLLMPSPTREQHDGYLRRYLRTGERYVVNHVREVVAQRKDGSQFPLQISVGECETGGRKLFIGAVQDITERKAIQKALEEASRAAQAASQAKSDFLATMSHELRTPLNGVIGMTELLLGTNLDAEQRRFAWLAKSSGDVLLSLINDILDFSKIEAGKLELESLDFDLSYAVENVAASFASRAQCKGLELAAGLHPDVPVLVRGDPGRLQQVLMNLVSNAVKFTDKGEIAIRATVDHQTVDEAFIRFTVRDTGLGIPDERLSGLFQVFSQGDPSITRQFGGTGLGLAICKRLVEMMSGTIGVTSRVGEGTTFWFTVRLAKQRVAPQPALSLPDRFNDLQILIVDDNQTNCEILHEHLSTWGCEHLAVHSGAEALAALQAAVDQNRPFQLAILDMHMPGMSGQELIRRIKATASLAETKAILLSSLQAEPDAGQLQHAGFEACLTKPVRKAQLLGAITNALLGAQAGHAESHENAPASTVSGNAGSGPALRILLAEDHPVTQEVGATMLRQAGHECVVANDGQEAVEAVLHQQFDMVFMDCQMPNIDGFEATRAIREAEARRRLPGGRKRRLPIIALTANAIRGDRERCLAAGMDDYLSKPLNTRRLLEVVKAHGPARWTDHAAPAGPKPAQSLAEPTRSPSSAPPLDIRPPFDYEKLSKQWGCDHDFCGSLIDKFRRQAARDLEQITLQVEANDADGVAKLAHALKGSAGYVCAEPMIQLATQLQRAGAAADMVEARALLERLRTEVVRCQAFDVSVRPPVEESAGAGQEVHG